MTDRARALILALAAVFVASACGGGAAAQTTAATTAPAAATLPATTAAAATLPPASAPASSATKTVAPTSTASAPSNDLVAAGKIVFTTIGPSGKGCQECHGANARGSTATDGTTAPSIVGTTETKLRNALAGSAALMTNLKLTDQQIDAVLAYLAWLDQQ